MTAKIFTGRDARMFLTQDGTDNLIAKVTSYSFQSELELLETTALNSNVKEFVPGIQSFSGQASLMYYKNDQNSILANRLLGRYFRGGTDGINVDNSFNLLFELLDGSTPRRVRFSTAYITNISLGASVGEVASMQISFQATGGVEASNIS